MGKFRIITPFFPKGDQPRAIKELTNGMEKKLKHQVLLGVTGSGKTFTIANVIANVNKPTLVIAHNKTLAAQLYGEFKAFFPENAVEYFVSYYDYYQPEAYIPSTHTKRDAFLRKLVDMLYERNEDFKRGTFRVRGDIVEIFPSFSGDNAIRVG